MAQEIIPEFKSGDPVLAAKVDLLRQEAERRKIPVSGGLFAKYGRFGAAIGSAGCNCDAFWILITRTYGTKFYDWTEKVPTASGGWTAGKKGVATAVEVNANAAVLVGTIVWGMWNDSHSYLLFQQSAC